MLGLKAEKNEEQPPSSAAVLQDLLPGSRQLAGEDPSGSAPSPAKGKPPTTAGASMALGMVASVGQGKEDAASASETVAGEEGVEGAVSAAHSDRGLGPPGDRGVPAGRRSGSEHSGMPALRAPGAAPWPQAVSWRSEARGAAAGEAAQRLLLSGGVSPWLHWLPLSGSVKQPSGHSGGKLPALRVIVVIEPAELGTFKPESAASSQPGSSRSRTAGPSRATLSPSSRSDSPSSHRIVGNRLAGSSCSAKHGSVKLLLGELLPGPRCKVPPSVSGPLSRLLESTSKCR